MNKKKITASEKGMLVNEQRFSMIVLLCNILDAKEGVSNSVKSAVAASLINMIVNRNEMARTSSNPGKTITKNHYLIEDKWYKVD